MLSRANPWRTALSARSARRSDDGLVMVDAWWIQSIEDRGIVRDPELDIHEQREAFKWFAYVLIGVISSICFEIEANTSEISAECL